MIVKLLTEHHLEFLGLKGGCRGYPSLHLSKSQLLEISCRGSNIRQSNARMRPFMREDSTVRSFSALTEAVWVRLRECEGLFVALLFAGNKIKFSRDGGNIIFTTT